MTAGDGGSMHGERVPDAAGEWLLTDGLGGFAMGSPSGVPTRRYHAWRIVAARPPVERFVALHSAVDSVAIGGRRVALSSYAFGEQFTRHPDVLPPSDVYLDSAQGVITWRWMLPPDGARRPARGGSAAHGEASGPAITRTLTLAQGTGEASVRYACSPVPGEAVLFWRPLMPLRDFHELDHAGSDDPAWTEKDGVITLRRGDWSAALHLPPGAARCGTPDHWRGFAYREDRDRGQSWQEDLFSPGEWRIPLSSDGSAVVFTVRGKTNAEVTHAARAACEPASREPASADPAGRDMQSHAATARVRLRRAAEQFLVRRMPVRSSGAHEPASSILAGYPWFTDWGRDTMIALPGLLLLDGRVDEARSALLLYAARMRRGLLPNCFDDIGDGAVYHTADASLWFLSAAAQVLDASRDHGGHRDDAALMDAARAVINAYREGTDFGIRLDGDGLIIAGDGGKPVTWMDAQRDGVSFTPRIGKPVELSALWHHDVLAMAGHVSSAKERGTLLDLAAQTAAGMRQFIRPGYGLHDLLEVDDRGAWRGDARIRPNQIFAVSLAPLCIDLSVAREVLATVRLHLLTPYGLRTLSPDDPAYRGRYEGTLFERDGAYHQGTVWPWLLGAYVEALLRVRADAINDAEAAIEPLLGELDHGCAGQLAEVYDGDPPHRPSGCPAQAWSIAEIRRAAALIDACRGRQADRSGKP